MSDEHIEIDAALIKANQRSVQTYLQRQVVAEKLRQLQTQGQQLQLQGQQIDMELIALDGEIRALEALKAGPRGE